ncbi:MAG: trypsin-like peptidase domain-containing protein [Fischerella sp.]|jgi:S1-C subfamily serine protease|uniref:HhoA/HhoB/HtrA family serine endopeptidase n=1 Tax=Fischerella sp. TaxID=1191 RepID=UPI00181BEFA7|nr:HhoA/HhoB/HtrA family serine endopeptidase [Fischerella sp.]NWF59137.1 trypsin-like peptidase domain-containing protein [Fischerella sp.]
MTASDQRFSPLRQVGSHALAVILSIALTLTTLRAFPALLLPNSQPQSSEFRSVTPTNVSVALDSDHSFVVAAVNRVGATVVRIDTERTIAREFPDPFFDDPFFRRFFGEDIFPRLPREYHLRGQGSGFIIDRNGTILTNAHVVSGADTVKVTLKDGRTFRGDVRGIDEPSDLAVVKIEGQNLPVAPLGNSSDVQVGDWAIALGNPLGLDNTVTLGIISTLNRSSAQVGIPDKRLDFIQTDAAINPGNSGGPLLNARGEVIGINTAIRAEAQGIGFAIPIDKAKAIKDRLARGEKIPHPYIGIRMLTLTPELAKQSNRDPNAPFTVPEINGVLVAEVMSNSPAASTGLRRGDVILEIDGNPIASADQLQNAVENSQIGQPLRLKVQRGKQTLQLTVRPGELQDAAP